jgi:hypothetical protein
MRAFALFLAILTLLLGCTRTDPVRPNADVDPTLRPISSGFYPLSLGNRWQLSRVLTLEYMLWGEPPGPVEVINTTYDFEQTCLEDLFGTKYTIEEQRSQDDQGGSGVRWIRYRQDATGLYEADVSFSEPPACATVAPSDLSASQRRFGDDDAWTRLIERLPEASRAAARAKSDEIRARVEAALGSARGAKATVGFELTRLLYPLTPGQSWYVRSNLLAEVEAIELLALPVGDVPAHRVRLTWVDFPEDLDILFWWGRCGQLAYFIRSESVVIDETGTPIGTVIVTEEAQVQDINLVDVRACSIARER